MTHKLTIELNQAEIHQAITDYALKNIDLGVPFSKDDVHLGRLTVNDAYLEIVPGKSKEAESSPSAVGEFNWAPAPQPLEYRPPTIDEDVPF